MKEPVVSAPSEASKTSLSVAGGHTLTESDVNALRIGAIAESLGLYVQSGERLYTGQFVKLCLSLARGIDNALANNEVPAKASSLPPIFKQVCKWRNEFLLQAAIMALMISVKNACKIGWFTSKETEDLLMLANEVGSNFSIGEHIVTEATTFLPTVSPIMSKFYPKFKLGHVLAFLEVKPGYGAYVVDFHIPKSLSYSPEEKVRLFVAQKDNADASLCITTPRLVNFLLNGKGVVRRNNVTLDLGPQIPTAVNPLLKFGTNLLQAVGQFDGHYIILIAFMSIRSSADLPTPPDYVPPVATTSESDSKIIEGSSRISLNCPISRRRIQMPIKGHLCKHHQILQEMGEKVDDVIISVDGSWKASFKTEASKDEPNNKGPDGSQEGKDYQYSPVPVDLTEADDERHTIDTFGTIDRKHVVHGELQTTCVSVDPAVPLVLRNAPEVNQNSVIHAESSFCSEAVSPVLNQGVEAFQGSSFTGSMMADQVQVNNNSRLQQSWSGKSVGGGEFGQLPPESRSVSRTPIASQSLTLLQLYRPSSNYMAANESLVSPQSSSPTSFPNKQHVSQSSNPPNMSKPLLLQHNQLASQVRGGHTMPAQSLNPYRVSSGNQTEYQHQHLNLRMPQTVSCPSHLTRSFHNPSTQGHREVHPCGINYTPNTFQRVQLVNAAAVRAAQRATNMAKQPPTLSLHLPTSSSTASIATPIDIDMSRTAVTGQRGTGGMPNLQAVSMADNLVDLQSENWRPSGRMRGSLSGRAYTEALSQFMIQPTQPIQTPRLPSSLTAMSSAVPSQFQGLAPNTQNGINPRSLNTHRGFS